MSKRRSVRRTPGQPNFILSAFKSIKFDFVLAIIVVILYISATVRLSLEKVLIIILGPVIAELILLGIDQFLVAWIRGATPIRSLVASIFGVVIGTFIIVTNSFALVGGTLIVILSALLAVWALWKYRSTRNLGLKSASLVGTVNTALFLVSLLLLTLGYFEFFLVVLFCSLIMLVHPSLPFSAFLTFVLAAVLYTVYGSVLYVLLVVSVEVAVQVFVNRAAAISMIRRASTLRTLVTSISGLIIGKALVSAGGAGIVAGAIVIAFSALLTLYGAHKYMVTRDLGIRSQDPIATANLVILFVAVLALIQGVLNLFAILISCCAMIFFYRQLVFEVPVMLVALAMVQGLFLEPALTITVLIVGIAMAVAGSILKRVEAQKLKYVARAKADTTPKQQE